MPYANEHACRIEEPNKFKSNSFRRIRQGRLSIIIGKKTGEDKTSTQAFRYPKDQWTEAEAKKHCQEQGGRFEAAE